MPMKKCSRCNTEKELTEFYKSIIGKKGEQLYKSGCIQCRRRPEKVWEPKPPKEKKKRVRNPEDNRKNSKTYYNKHREELLKIQRDNRLLKKLNKFPVIEAVVKDEAIPVELL